MADELENKQCCNKVERSANKAKISSCNYSRKKNSSFSSVHTPEKYSLNYYSDNASGYVQSSAKKCRQRRSLSSSPTMSSHYAGAKFSEPPSPSVLPVPPVHWIEIMPADTTPRSVTPANFQRIDSSYSSTPISKTGSPAVNQSVEHFFQKCSHNHNMSTDFTCQLRTLLNVSV